MSSDSQHRITQQFIDKWKLSLLDLTKRNRLLYFHQGLATRIHIAQPDIPGLCAELVENDRALDFPWASGLSLDEIEFTAATPSEVRILTRGLIVEPPVATVEQLRDLYRKLERLRRNTKTIYEEQGVHTLFLTLGFLRWWDPMEASPQRIDSPLLLLPVQIERVEERYRLKAFENDIQVNQTLAFHLQQSYHFQLPRLEDIEDYKDSQSITETFLARVAESAAGRGWEVKREAWLAQLAFYKLPMYQDLATVGVASQIAGHPVLGPICGVRQPPESAVFDLREIEEHYASPETFPVLDTDSSQLEVLERARRGETMVVQGPPGTGKSQTIVNLIAQALREGKRVLFVSEKRAALEVVYRRLQQLGLADMCLDLHSYKASRKAVVEELVSTLETHRQRNIWPAVQEFSRYRQLRTRLVEYIEALHRPRDAYQRSAYHFHGVLAQLNNVPVIRAQLPFPSALNLAQEYEAAIDDVLRKLEANPAWDYLDQHPWREANPEAAITAVVHQVRDDCRQLASCCRKMAELAGEIGELLEVTVNAVEDLEVTLRTLAVLTKCHAPFPKTWVSLDEKGRDRFLQLSPEIVTEARTRDELAANLQSTSFPLKLAQENVDLLTHLADEWDRAGWWGRFWLKRKIRQAVARILSREISRQDAVSIIQTFRALHRTEEKLKHLISEALAEAETDRGLVERIALLAELYSVLPHRTIPHSLGTKLSSSGILDTREHATRLVDELISLLEEFRRLTGSSELSRLFPNGYQGIVFSRLSLPELADWARHLYVHAAELQDWILYLDAMREAYELGLGPFLSECQKRRIPRSQLKQVYLRAFADAWLHEAYLSDPILNIFSASSHESLRSEFQDLDRRLQQSAIEVTLARAASNVQQLPQNELRILRAEANKRRRHLPLRRLIPQIPNLLLSIKPCLMMSPLTVAMYLPKDIFRFDLVLIDEASQLPPADAVGPILRANQAIIFGDSKQLPPTDFFQSHVETEDDEVEALSFESILDLASVPFPGPMLRWHYRSRDERLIAFSNRYFYDRKLVTFPNPSTDGGQSGVRYVLVPDGVYGRGGSKTNPTEARRVAELVLEHFRTHPDRSLGVIAMSIQQRDAIEDQIRRLRREYPEILLPENETEPFFVKNLETVQGDERDVIILSVGYGPTTPGGPVPVQFGPLNRQGGERRLNVAITRARERLIVVSSFTPDQLNVETTRWEGPRVLAAYLRYAKSGGFDEASWGTGQPESPFEEAVRDALIRYGYSVDCQVGVSQYRIDLAVRDPDNPGCYLVGIECDGRTYHNTPTARDRDRIRQQVLEDLGWTILRVWSTDWIRSPEQAIERLVQQIEAARQHRAGEKLRRSNRNNQSVFQTPETSTQPVSSMSRNPGRERDEPKNHPSTSDNIELAIQFSPYSRYTNSQLTGCQILDEPLDSLANLIQTIVRHEGPIHIEQLLERVRDLYGVQRLGRRIHHHITQALNLAVKRRLISRRDSFFWRPEWLQHNLFDVVTPRGVGDVMRSPGHIAPEEWQAAVLEALRQLGVTERRVLVSAIAQGMGYKRTPAEVRLQIEQAITVLHTVGRVFERGGLIYLT